MNNEEFSFKGNNMMMRDKIEDKLSPVPVIYESLGNSSDDFVIEEVKKAEKADSLEKNFSFGEVIEEDKMQEWP